MPDPSLLRHRHCEIYASGLALLATATGLARLLASVLFGALWTWGGVQSAVILYLVALAVAILLTIVVLARTRDEYREPIAE